MEHRKVVEITKTRAALFEKYLNWKEGDNPDIRLNEDDWITNTAVFDNGVEMDIKICGVQYEDGGDNAAWTEAVLFSSEGEYMTSTDVCDEYLGEWELEYGGDKYIAEVKVA